MVLGLHQANPALQAHCVPAMGDLQPCSLVFWNAGALERLCAYQTDVIVGRLSCELWVFLVQLQHIFEVGQEVVGTNTYLLQVKQ